MKVSSRIALASGLWAAALISVLGYNFAQVKELSAGHRELAEVDLRATTLAIDQRNLVSQIDSFTRKLLVTRDPAYAEHLATLRSAFGANLDELHSLGLAEQLSLEVQVMARRWRELPLSELADTLLVEETSLNPLAETRDVERESRLMELFVEQSRVLQEQCRILIEATQGSVREQAARSVAASERAVRVSWMLAVAGLTLSLPFLWLTVRSIRRPLLRLREGTRSVADGEYTVKLATEGTDEFAPVTESFNLMVERLGELDRAKRDFLSHVSHELKTPLAAMYETDSLLLEELPGRLTEKQRRLLQLSLENNSRLEKMISKLLDLSQLEEGALEYSMSACELNELLAGVVESYSAMAWTESVALSLATTAPVEVHCDRDRVIQVLSNLVENAIRFAPSGSAVRIDVAATPNREEVGRLPSAQFAVVRIGDRGPGVPDPEKSRVFERFHQVRKKGRSGSGSVGLGLAIAQEIVADHGGAIWVSDRPQGGAMFSIALPLAEELQQAASAG